MSRLQASLRVADTESMEPSVNQLLEQASQAAGRFADVLHKYADFGFDVQRGPALHKDYVAAKDQLNDVLRTLYAAYPDLKKPIAPEPIKPQPAPTPVNPVPAPADPVPQPVPVEPKPQLDLTRPNWLGEWSGRQPRNYVQSLAASAGKQTLLLIGYFMYGRDNGNYSAGGAHSEAEFLGFYQGIADGVGDVPTWVVLEPDSLGLLDGLSAQGKEQRLRLLQKAIDILNAKSNITIWLDVSSWLSAEEAARRLSRFTGIDGFSLNVSGYHSIEDLTPWAEQVSKTTGYKYVIDTSRNGRGNPHKPAWCNVIDTLIGIAPTTETHAPNCAAYIWAKVPGESDGSKINGYDGDGQKDRSDIPRAGEPWPEFREAIYSGNWTAFKVRYGVK